MRGLLLAAAAVAVATPWQAAFGGDHKIARFTDVTAAAGIDYVQHELSSQLAEAVHFSGAAAAGDFDRDGFDDLYVTRLDRPDILYRNRGDGTFENVTQRSGIDRGLGSNGAGWADLDNDGDLDLYVTTIFDSRFYLYINDGRCRFTEEGRERGAALEGDDLHFGFSVAFADYDRDGFLDIHTTEWRLAALNPTDARSNSRLLRNRGAEGAEFAGTFVDVTEAAGLALDAVEGRGTNPNPGSFSFASRFTDLDGDGLLDLAVVSDFGESRLFWNNGDGTFTDGTMTAGVGAEENGMGLAIGDIDGDGWLDWFVSSISGEQKINHTGNRLYRNNGDRTFTEITDRAGVRDGGWGWAATFIDYDNDGDLDLALANGVDFPNDKDGVGFDVDAMRFWENDGAGNYSEIAAEIGLLDTGVGRGVVKFDFDADGDLDMFVVNNRSRPVLYRNDGGNTNGWLRVRVSGPLMGIGARLTLTATPGAPPQVQEINAGSNYLSQNELTAHFGVGPGEAPVHRLAVRWQDGAVQSFSDLPRNRTVALSRERGVAVETAPPTAVSSCAN